VQWYYFRASFNLVEIVRPLLHDAATLFKVSGAHVCRRRRLAFAAYQFRLSDLKLCLGIKKPAKAIRSAGL